MLRFLRKSLANIRTRHRFLGKTICLSVGMHALIACSIMIGMRFNGQSTIILSKKEIAPNSRIVLVPFMKHVPSQGLLSAAQQKPLAVAARTAEKKKPSVSGSKTTKSSIVHEPIKAVRAQKVDKKEDKPKAPLSKKQDQSTKEDTKKNERVQKKQHTEKPSKQQTASLEKKSIKKEESSDKAKTDTVKKEQQVQESSEQVMYVGRDDLQELQFQTIVSNRVQKEWQPPAGAPLNAVCTVSFIIGSSGCAIDIVLVESSQSVLYDIAARMAVARAHFEPSMYGKKCQIVFKQ